MSLILLSCASEDPNLVNPKLPNQTIRVRFFNLAKDKLPRTLVLSSDTKTQSTPYNTISLPVMPPPLDSVYVASELNGTQDYQLPRRQRLIRDTKYIFFGLSKANSVKNLDTIIVNTTTYTPLKDKNNCFISMINLDPDTTRTYSLVMGCSNGPSLFQYIRYLQSSIDFETIPVEMPVSIIKTINGVTTNVGLYNLQLFKGGEFLIVITDSTDNSVKMINKQDTTINALTTLTPNNNKQAYIRTINFSSSDITITKYPNDTINSKVSSGNISDYNVVSTCTSPTIDSLIITSSGSYLNSATTSLIVNSRYSLVVFDSANVKGKLSLIVPPKTLTTPLGDSAMIRVINACPGPDLTLSMGARDSKILKPSDSLNPGFVSGEFLTNKISYGKISNAVYLPSGRAPLTLFTASQPNQLLQTAIGQLKAGSQYIAIITKDASSNYQISLIEDGDVSKGISSLENGAFLQIANLTPGSLSHLITIPGVLSSSKLYYGNSLATVVPIGQVTIQSDNITANYQSFKDKREIAVIAGTAMLPEFLLFESNPPAYNYSQFDRRVFNAAKDAPSIDLTYMSKEVDPNVPNYATNVVYGGVVLCPSSNIERKSAYFFYTSGTKELLLQVNDIAMVLGKSYTIIFGGDKTVTKQDPLTYRYSIILLQDY